MTYEFGQSGMFSDFLLIGIKATVCWEDGVLFLAEAREITITPRLGARTGFDACCYGSYTMMISPLRGKEPLNSNGTA